MMKDMDYNQTDDPETVEERMLSAALKAPEMLRPVPARLAERFASHRQLRHRAFFANRRRLGRIAAALALCALTAVAFPIATSALSPTQEEQDMNTAKLLAAPAAALAIATSAPQTAPAAMDDWQGNAASPVVVIIVDVDMSLSDALTANSVSLAGAASFG